jgi:flagellar FliL protein
MADDKKDEEVNASLDGEGAPEEGAEGGGSGGKKKLIIIVVVLLFVLGGAGAGLYFSGFLDKVLKKGETTEEGHEAAEGEHGKEVCTKNEEGKEVCGPPGAQFLKIPDMIVNLNSEDGTPRYLRLSVQLEFKSAEDIAKVELLMPRIVDQFQTYLRELRVRDLRGSAGIYRLQLELLARVNQAAYPVEVQDVLFQEILIQ